MRSQSNTTAKRKPTATAEEQMRDRLRRHHKQAVTELEQIRRVEEYRSLYVRIMMATSPTLIDVAPMHELDRIDDWIEDQFDLLGEEE